MLGCAERATPLAQTEQPALGSSHPPGDLPGYHPRSTLLSAHRSRLRLCAVTAALALSGTAVTLTGLPALAHPSHDGGGSSDDARDAKQHDGQRGHLPATQHNVELVGQTSLRNVEPEKIADVSVHKGYAYLAAWGVTTCKANGVHVVDVRNPKQPTEVAFVPSKEGSYPGEGVHALTLSTPAFSGDLLVTNNERCNATAGFGGLNLYDVSNPQRPTPLAVGIGDSSSSGTATASGEGKKGAHDIHSVFAWDVGDRAYAAIVDNDEAVDVDIMDITDPRAPFLTAEYDLGSRFPSILQASPGNLTEVFLHDMVVKQVGTRFHMSANYWDAGYVVLDVTDVQAPTLVAQTDYPAKDPELAGTPHEHEAPEGNAHQSEWTKDHTHLIGTDEDFAPYRSGPFTIGGVAYPATAVSGGGTAADTTDKTLNGRAVYGGYGCPGSAAIPPAKDALPSVADGEERIVVLQRGPSGDPTATEEACFPGEKAAAARAAGYDGVVLANRHFGSEAADEAYCGAGGYPVGDPIPTVCTTHGGLHDLFGTTRRYNGYPDGPALGAVSTKAVSATALFNGWGYVHLFGAKPGKKGLLPELDTYAVPEAHDPKYAKGFGDLSVHEVATSPTRNDLAYYAYYSAGMRVTKIVDGQLVEVGRYVDPRGSDFWGVEAFTIGNVEYFAGSDRHYGLQIFRYTGD